MDKTGTITKASLHVEKIITDCDKDEVIKIVKGLEKNSNHPIALAIKELEGQSYDFEITEEAGYGIIGKDSNHTYFAGNHKLLAKYNIEFAKTNETGTFLYLAKDSEYIGLIILKDTIKDEAKLEVSNLHNMKKKVVVLSGDASDVVSEVCNEIGIDKYYAELLPNDKVSLLEQIIKTSEGKTMYIGDGINDAPVLAMSDIGVSMGQIGSDAAIEASDVVILNDDLSSVSKMLKIAKRTRRIVFENIFISIGIKVAVLILTVLGLVGIEFAIFADVGVCVIAILNAMRALNDK
jgi:Cd2+/Zn2+-exporting ATPase